MPGPLVIAGAAVGLLGGFSASKQAKRNAREIAAFKQRKFELAKQFGTEAYHRFTLEVHTRHRQDHDILTRQVRGINEVTLQREGQIAASAGGSGVAGASVAAELGEEQKTLQRALGDVRLQREFLDVSAELELRAGRASIRERILAAEPSPTPQVDNASVFFNTISGGFSGAAAGAGLKGVFG